ALRAGDAAFIRKPPLPAELPIDARVELRLVGAAIGERGAERPGAVSRIRRAADLQRRVAGIRDERNGSGGTRKRRLREITRRDLVRPRVVRRIGEAPVDAAEAARALSRLRTRVTAHEAAGERHLAALRLARALRDD